MRTLLIILASLGAFQAFGTQARGSEEPPLAPLSADLCAALMAPHLKIAELFPRLTDDQVLHMIHANYSEMMTWLSQKAETTAEGAGDSGKGNYGPNRNLTPSKLLFGREIVEVDRTAVGILALKWILANDYAAFTANQPPPIKLSPASFLQLRTYILSVLKTPEDIDAMIVMILTNDLGKVRRYHDLTEKAVGRVIVDHDELLFVGFSEWSETAPNFHRLSRHQKTRIIDGLQMGSGLNIGQFAQAENLPTNLAAAKVLAGKLDSFEFKFIELLLDVAGARGHVNSAGAAVMIEPVFKNFMLGRTALLKVIEGGSLREAYDQILIARAELLKEKGFQPLSVNNAEERALLRILTMSRTDNLEQAQIVASAFHELPDHARAILVSELNVNGDTDGWGILPYYAPALFDNAKANPIKNSSKRPNPIFKDGKFVLEWIEDPTVAAEAGALDQVIESSKKDLYRYAMLALARTFQEGRIEIAHMLKSGKKPANGVLTVNVEYLATFVRSVEFKRDPSLLLNLQYKLAAKPGEDNSFTMMLSRLHPIAVSEFPSMGSLANLKGSRFVVAGIGGGSDVIQAAQLAYMLKAAGKQVDGLLSFRTSKLGSQGNGTAKVGEARVYENSTVLSEGILQMSSASQGNGRDLEPLVASEFKTLMVLIEEQQDLKDRIVRALGHIGLYIDGIILVDTGGDSLYPAVTHDLATARSTPDQDLHVLSAFGRVAESLSGKLTITSAVMAAGVDSPENAAAVLKDAGAQYFETPHSDVPQILARYQGWHLDGSSDRYYGKTPYAWQAALQGASGVAVVPLPLRVILDRGNPWTPFIKVPVTGVFFMDVLEHLRAISGREKGALN